MNKKLLVLSGLIFIFIGLNTMNSIMSGSHKFDPQHIAQRIWSASDLIKDELERNGYDLDKLHDALAKITDKKASVAIKEVLGNSLGRNVLNRLELNEAMAKKFNPTDIAQRIWNASDSIKEALEGKGYDFDKLHNALAKITDKKASVAIKEVLGNSLGRKVLNHLQSINKIKQEAVKTSSKVPTKLLSKVTTMLIEAYEQLCTHNQPSHLCSDCRLKIDKDVLIKCGVEPGPILIDNTKDKLKQIDEKHGNKEISKEIKNEVISLIEEMMSLFTSVPKEVSDILKKIENDHPNVTKNTTSLTEAAKDAIDAAK